MTLTHAPVPTAAPDAWQTEELHVEVAALRADLAKVGHELGYWSHELLKAVHLERPDRIEHAAGRLSYLSQRLQRQSEAEA